MDQGAVDPLVHLLKVGTYYVHLRADVTLKFVEIIK